MPSQAPPAPSIQVRSGPHVYSIELSLTALLSRYSSAALREMFKILHRGKSPSGSKDTFLAAVHAHLRDPARRLAEHALLSGEAQHALHLLLSSSQPAFSDAEAELLIHGHGLPSAVLTELLQRGFLLGADVRRMFEFGQKDCLLVPAPLLPPLPTPPPQKALALPVVPHDRLKAVRLAEPSHLGQLLRKALDYIAHHRLRITRDGWMVASHIGPLARALHLEAPEAPIPLPLLLDILVRGGLLLPEEDGLQPAPDALARLQRPLHESLGELFSFFTRRSPWIDDTEPAPPRVLYDQLRSHSYGDPYPEDMGPARQLLSILLSRMSPDQWIPVDALCAEALRLNPRFLWSVRQSYFGYHERHIPLNDNQRRRQLSFARSYLLRTCASFGLVDVGSLTGEFPPSHHSAELNTYGPRVPVDKKTPQPPLLPPSPLAIRLSALGRTVLQGAPPVEGTTRLVVGPDFEVVAPLDRVSAQALFLLGQIAVRTPGHPDDPVARFTLRQESWVRTLQNHPEPPEAILAQLIDWNGQPLPPNVDRTLREWSQSVGQIQLIEGADLLVFDTPQMRDHALSSLQGAQAIGDRFALVSSALDLPPWGKDATPIDYLQPPKRCLLVHLDGRIQILPKLRDFLVEAELTPFSEGAPGALERRLTPASVKGWRSGDILSRLATRATLPAGLTAAVRGWCGELAAAPLAKALLLQLPPEVAADLLHHRDFAASIQGSVAPGILVVQDLPALKAALQRLNISTQATFLLS